MPRKEGTHPPTQKYLLVLTLKKYIIGHIYHVKTFILLGFIDIFSIIPIKKDSL
jgi:hypothetical protein